MPRALTTDLSSALSGCGLVLATTGRERDQNFRVLDPRAAARQAVEHAARMPVATFFGAERTGLTNEELRYAHALLAIPANPVYPSLNVAMAVQIVAYEIMCAMLERTQEAPRAITSPAVPLARSGGARSPLCPSGAGAAGDRFPGPYPERNASDETHTSPVSAGGA